jgi:hypothetical protein
MRRALPVVASLLVMAACGGSSPTAPRFPAVNGSYAGTISVAYPELGQSVTCPATTNVTQTGANVSVAPIILAGACAGLSIPIGNITIDQNGSFGNIANYTFFEPSCGGNYTASGSGGFFGRQLQFSLNAVSSVCWNINMTANLTR